MVDNVTNKANLTEGDTHAKGKNVRSRIFPVCMKSDSEAAEIITERLGPLSSISNIEAPNSKWETISHNLALQHVEVTLPSPAKVNMGASWASSFKTKAHLDKAYIDGVWTGDRIHRSKPTYTGQERIANAEIEFDIKTEGRWGNVVDIKKTFKRMKWRGCRSTLGEQNEAIKLEL